MRLFGLVQQMKFVVQQFLMFHMRVCKLVYIFNKRKSIILIMNYESMRFQSNDTRHKSNSLNEFECHEFHI